MKVFLSMLLIGCISLYSCTNYGDLPNAGNENGPSAIENAPNIEFTIDELEWTKEMGMMILQSESTNDATMDTIIFHGSNQERYSLPSVSKNDTVSSRMQWNTNRSQYVFAYSNNTGSGIYIFHTDKRKIEAQLWSSGQQISYSNPFFGADDTQILFVQNSLQHSELGILDLASGNTSFVPLEDEKEIQNIQLDKSNENVYILTKSHLKVVQLSADLTTRDIPLEGEVMTYSYSPSLQYLAAVTSTDHGNALFLLRIDEEILRGIKTLSTQYTPSPSWSPNEDYIAFHDSLKGLDDIFLYSVLDSSLQNITQTPHEKDIVYSHTNPWSEDGRYLAFTTYDGDTWATRRMGLFDAFEKRILYVSSFEDQNLFLEWGKRDIFSFQTGHSHDGFNIGVQTIDSKMRMDLNTFMHNKEGKFLSHAWSPDGTWFGYVYDDNHSMLSLRMFNVEDKTCREYSIPIKTSNPISMQWYVDKPFLDV
ncbi:MAG: hypothetical protein PHI40_08330 [Caldisericia bacterium]|nr:hypothetical protein [Caldisericia bacterium]